MVRWLCAKALLGKVLSVVQGNCHLLESDDSKKIQEHLSCTRTKKRQIPELACTAHVPKIKVIGQYVSVTQLVMFFYHPYDTGI